MQISDEGNALWQIPRSKILPFAQTFPIPAIQDTGPRSYSEADLHAYTIASRRRETIPPTIPRFTVGTWCIDMIGDLWQLRQERLCDLSFRPQNNPYATQDERGYSSEVWPWVVEKYVAWLQAGHEPPPLRGVERQDGSILVTDGNNRAASLVLSGRHEALIWVSVATRTETGFCASLTHQQIVADALHAGLPVPPDVLAEYPALAAGAGKSENRMDEA